MGGKPSCTCVAMASETAAAAITRFVFINKCSAFTLRNSEIEILSGFEDPCIFLQVVILNPEVSFRVFYFFEHSFVVPCRFVVF